MSRRYSGAGARSGPSEGPGLARHRWAASLGPVPEEALLDLPAAGPPSAEAYSSGAPAVPAFRWRTGRRAAALIAVVSVLLGGWFWWQAADGAPRVQPLGEAQGWDAARGSGSAGAPAEDAGSGGVPAADAPADADVPGPTAAPATIIVHVAGAVARAGVVELPRGSRVHEAIQAAGGSTRTADLDRLNLAAVIEDGQKILVPERGSPDPAEPGPGPTAGGGASTGGRATSGGTPPPAGKINLNSAGLEELATLPHVGPVLAQRIVDWRQQHGSFGSVEELDAVDGIGPKLLEALRPLVKV